MDEKELLEIIDRAAKDGRTKLDLSGKKIKSLPPQLGKLANLTRLSLSNNQLTSVPPKLGQLTNLTELYLSGNQLSTLPPEIAKLTNLKKLYLDFNEITSLPPQLGQLTNLTGLSLSSNQLTSVPPQLFEPTNLTGLSLSNNQLTSVPPQLGQLTNLTWLDLSINQLTSVPPQLGKLANLTRLDLGINQLTSVPLELAKLTNLTVLSLYGNPLESPPPEVIKQGTKAVLAYLRELAEKERPCWVSKLLFVGEGGVGKTSLLKRLLGEKFDPDEKTTHGLRIRLLEKPHPKDSSVKMSLNAWDFGGQYVLHATHQFFLTGRSLFILVWNARYGWQQGKLYYWLDMIKAQAPESPVLIVATHTEDWSADLPYEDIRDSYPQVCGRFSVSNDNGAGIDELEVAIQREAARLPLMGKSRPAKWLDVAEEIQEIAKEKKYIYPNKLDDIMIQKKVKEEDRKSLAGWLHDLGYLLYFQDNPELSDIVILNAEWVASNISRMLEDEAIEKGLGIFKSEHMEAVWPTIDPPIRDVFLRLMEQFDLSFRTLENKDISIVVERLSLDPSESAKGYEELWDARQEDNEIAMKFYLHTSLPPGIPTWFIARSHRFTTYKHWRYGALFTDGKDKKHLALVRAFDHERYITLKTRGPAPHNFFALLRDGLELTLNRYSGLNIERTIPCPGHGKELCPYEFDLKLVERALEKGKKTVECHESSEDVSVSQLLYGLDLRPDSAVMKRLEELSAEVSKTATETQNKIKGRVDLLENEMVRDLGVILTELVELRELSQREFLRSFNAQQRLAESHCPNVFAVLPKEEKGWIRDIFEYIYQRKVILQLYCQAPGYWHPTQKGGRYEIKQPVEFFDCLRPYILKLAKVLKYVIPLVGPIAGIADKVFEEETKHQIKLMGELANKLRDEALFLDIELGVKIGADGIRTDYVEGSELRVLRKLLDEVDPQQEWGGLKKVLTPEGHYLWLCEEHTKEYKK